MLAFYMSMIDTPDEQNKFRQIYEEYKGLMFVVANQILHDDSLSEDAVHTAFTRILPNLNKIEDVFCHKTKGYVIIVVENVAKQMYNRRKKESLTSFDDLEYELSSEEQAQPDQAVIGRMSLESIVKQIKALPDIYRDVMLLKYLHDFSDKEISRVLKVTQPTVRKRLERGKAKLISLLAKEEASDEQSTNHRPSKAYSGAGMLS